MAASRLAFADGDPAAGRRAPAAHLDRHHGLIRRIGWSPDGRLLATPSRDGTVRIWVLHRLAGHGVVFVAFDAEDGMLATGSAAGTIMLWEIPNEGNSERLTGMRTDPLTTRSYLVFPDSSISESRRFAVCQGPPALPCVHSADLLGVGSG